MRALVKDYIQTHRFHLIDLTAGIGSFGTNYPVDVPGWSGFSFISMPDITATITEIRNGNYEYSAKFINVVSFGSVNLKKGVTWYESDFYYWMIVAATGRCSRVGNLIDPGIRKNLLLIQFAPVSGGGDSIAEIYWKKVSFGNNVYDGKTLKIAKMILLENCIPKKYRPGSDLDAASATISIAELEVEPETITEIMVPPETAIIQSIPTAGLAIARFLEMNAVLFAK